MTLTTLGDLLSQTTLSAIKQHVVLATVRAHAYQASTDWPEADFTELAPEQGEAIRDGHRLADPALEVVHSFTKAVLSAGGWPGDAEVQGFLDAGHTPDEALALLFVLVNKTREKPSSPVVTRNLTPDRER